MDERQEISKRWRSRLSAWMILIFLIVGWGPILVTDLVWPVSPSGVPNYEVEGFAMSWIPVVVLSSSLAIASFVAMVVFQRQGK
jgi:hypothetical protein